MKRFFVTFLVILIIIMPVASLTAFADQEFVEPLAEPTIIENADEVDPTDTEEYVNVENDKEDDDFNEYRNTDAVRLDNGEYYVVEHDDSFKLDPTEAEFLKKSSTDKVVKLYRASFFSGFAKKHDIDTILQGEVYTEYVVIPITGYVHFSKVVNGHNNLINCIFDNYRGKQWMDFLKYAYYPGLVFDSSVKVNKTYCLDSTDMSHGDMCIYYSTNKGDYILFNNKCSKGEEEGDIYLFSLDEFCEMAKGVMDIIVNNDKDGYRYYGSLPFDQVVDLSAYKFTPKYYKIVLIALPVVILVSTIIYLIVRKKKRKIKSRINMGESQKVNAS